MGRQRSPRRVWTVGHGTLPEEDFVELLEGAGIERLVDVRSYPGSRRNPQFARQTMDRWLPEHGIAYTWEPRLGGRRRPHPDSDHVGLRNDQFRAYADHMESREFDEGVTALLAVADRQRVAVMCAESVWWRCHRRLLADTLVLVHGVEVVHLMHDGRSQRHEPTPEARVGRGHLVYDRGTTPPLL